MTPNLRVYLVDDELLAVKRLSRLLTNLEGVEIVGSTTNPAEAIDFLTSEQIDVLFLDIQMPGLNGFQLLEKLSEQPMVIFTTAYDNYALRAFEVNSIDYLLKPIEPEQLKRSLKKLETLRASGAKLEANKQIQSVLKKLAETITPAKESLDRISSRVGDKILFIELSRITHFFAENKLTYASTESKNHAVDHTISELEQKLESKQFIRIHRSTIVNLALVDELHAWFGGRMLVRMKDKKRTDLVVARDRVRILKEKLGIKN
ncbi:MAG TPA: LytTR family DNA-binding domain-containing protein [Blastocatellia bacterium]|nr:LytTR family DNA-binding domain-containing protein [Blastocatellia bacterium]